MPFTRIKLIKNREYLYIVKSIRENKKVKQKVIKYIGAVKPVYKAKKRKSNSWLFVRKLTKNEEDILKKSLKSSSSFTRDRALIILLSSKGNDCNKIKEKVSCEIRKVRSAIKSFNEKGIDALIRGKARGLKPKFTKEEKTNILEIATTEPKSIGMHFTTWSLRKLRRYLLEKKIVKNICIGSIWNIFKEENFNWKKSKRFQYSNDREFSKKTLD